MSKFKIGDEIIANKQNPYLITDRSVILKVVQNMEDGFIKTVLIKPSPFVDDFDKDFYKSYIGDIFTVREEHFTKVNSFVEWD